MSWQVVVLVLGIIYAFVIMFIVSGWRATSAADRSERIRQSIVESEKALSGKDPT
jgi:hypothetical protein